MSAAFMRLQCGVCCLPINETHFSPAMYVFAFLKLAIAGGQPLEHSRIRRSRGCVFAASEHSYDVSLSTNAFRARYYICPRRGRAAES